VAEERGVVEAPVELLEAELLGDGRIAARWTIAYASSRERPASSTSATRTRLLA
jgi:hypothetical protein